ncbi:hypothetical protein CASFOL_018546 [Castilleja foliolosa]|uniref:Tafazzin family protein n=1 Tax=Castilleja foliolosa TaxID=1961234 RepID=A0ABD3D509_9LAMI
MRTMEWAAKRDHLGGIPRKMIFMAVGAVAKAVANLLNSTTVDNAETLLRLVRHRPPAVPLLTVSNHMSTLDDPVMWGFKGFPITDADSGRWVLAAEDICFKNPIYSYFFRLGVLCASLKIGKCKYLFQEAGALLELLKWKCIPITRGGRIYQEHMNEALDRLTDGAWLHTFPEGKVCQEDAPIRRLKWGTASLIARAPVTPIVLPIVHHGFEKVMPENFMFGKKPPVPLCNKDIKIVIGEPISFDVPKLKQRAVKMSRDLSYSHDGWPKTVCGLDEAAQRCLYTTISEQIQGAMERLRDASKPCSKQT